jgi:hypothetical protein
MKQEYERRFTPELAHVHFVSMPVLYASLKVTVICSASAQTVLAGIGSGP